MRGRCTRIAALLAVALVGCARESEDEAGLRDSFVRRIAETSGVTDFVREGAELTFSGPDGQGGRADWQVLIDTSLVEPSYEEEFPFQGRITSEWIQDGQVVVFLGNMSALPTEFLDRGLGQECWAYWVEAEGRWDW